MKQSESSNSNHPWPPFINQTPHLQLDTLDFSDLWGEEDQDLDFADDESSQHDLHSNLNLKYDFDATATPPAPPLAPPLPQAHTVPLDVSRRTLRLHWKELVSLQPLPRVSRFGQQSIWASLEPVHVDTNRLKYLFESKGGSSKAFSARMGGTRNQQFVSVLGVKRSNIITIALSSLPPPHLLPPAIYTMDSSVLDREDLQRLQCLIPSEEELNLIEEASSQTPRLPLAPAEQCLLILGNVTNLSSRLQLWSFALDYDTLEKEIAEPLYHLKLAMEQIATNQTFRCILATVLAIGNFLNGCKAKGFELSYLGKLSQVRDTHSRQPLLHHVCVLLLQLYPQSSDLYSDITAVTRASKCDYLQVQSDLSALESLCKVSWEKLRQMTKDDERRGAGRIQGGKRGGSEVCLYQKLPQFLKDCGERLKVLRAVHRRVINRFHSFLLYLGYSRSMVRETSADAFCKIVNDFALEYRATHNAILQQKERDQGREKERGKGEGKAKDGSSSKTKAKAIQSPSQDSVEQSMLEEVLKTPESSFCFDTSLPRHRSKTPNPGGPPPQRLKC